MRVFVRHIHKVSQRPALDTAIEEFDGVWTLGGVWRWLKARDLAGGLAGAAHRAQDDGFVYFLAHTYHSVIVGPLDGPLAEKYNGRRGAD